MEVALRLHQAPTWGRGEVVVHLVWASSLRDREFRPLVRLDGRKWNWEGNCHAWAVAWVGWWPTE